MLRINKYIYIPNRLIPRIPQPNGKHLQIIYDPNEAVRLRRKPIPSAALTENNVDRNIVLSDKIHAVESELNGLARLIKERSDLLKEKKAVKQCREKVKTIAKAIAMIMESIGEKYADFLDKYENLTKLLRETEGSYSENLTSVQLEKHFPALLSAERAIEKAKRMDNYPVVLPYKNYWIILDTATTTDFAFFMNRLLSAPAPRQPDKPDVPQDLDPEAIRLRDGVRENKGMLLFTRNVSLEEFRDIARFGQLRSNRGSLKYFRYGLGHEYGKEGEVIVLVMKKSFWEQEKDQSALKNLFLFKINGKTAPGMKIKILNGPDNDIRNAMIYRDYEVGADDREELLKTLAENAEYNRLLEKKSSPCAGMMSSKSPGLTVSSLYEEKYMGLFPQLEVAHSVSLDQVERIMVPEHLFDEVMKAAQGNPQLAGLIQKVSGTGKTREEFLSGQDDLARRSRSAGGGIVPNFGRESFFLFEQSYFRILRDCRIRDYFCQILDLIKKYDYQAVPDGTWIHGKIDEKPARNKNHWKIFVNPREHQFIRVLEAVLYVLQRNRQLKIEFKVPANLRAYWRIERKGRKGRKFNHSSSPKIAIYVDDKTLPFILRQLDMALSESDLLSAGYGDESGPSFSKRYGSTDLLFYKKEYFSSREDQRADIANMVVEQAEKNGITDEKVIRKMQEEALKRAGFGGECFYKREDDADPLV